MLVAPLRGETQSLVPPAVMFPMSSILKGVYFYFEWSKRRFAPLLWEVLELKEGKHSVACTAVLNHLLQPGRGFQPPDLQTWLHIHFNAVVENKRENREECSEKSTSL